MGWNSPLCSLLGIEVPIIQAPVGAAATVELAAAVSSAGGLGMLALSWDSPAQIRERLRAVRRLTGRPVGANFVLAWDQRERLQACVAEGIRVVSFTWGDPAPYVDDVHRAGGIVLHTVSSTTDARKAVSAGVDVLIAQGWEAGGHVRGAVATFALVPSIVEAVRPTSVVAAGGIADGRGMAAALTLGAVGVWIGTRFVASAESGAHPVYKRALVAASENDTVHTTLFDVGWPDAPHRVLRNATVSGWEAAGCPNSPRRPGEGEVVANRANGEEIVRYASASPTSDVHGDIDAMAQYAGQGVGLIRSVLSAAEIVEHVSAEAARALLEGPSWLGRGVESLDCCQR
jgi:NAD(P)H-dependent flavin oxidoreductase YrpB (nitropropane dioxygenase family)